MKQLKSFTIDRKVWLRGEGGRSMLYRPEDSKMCCLGIFMAKCGVPKSVLADHAIPNNLEQEWLEQLPSFLSDRRPVDELMSSNDDVHLYSEKAREAAITKGFKDVGIKVRFKG
jgi:hypothetical protein